MTLETFSLSEHLVQQFAVDRKDGTGPEEDIDLKDLQEVGDDSFSYYDSFAALHTSCISLLKTCQPQAKRSDVTATLPSLQESTDTIATSLSKGDFDYSYADLSTNTGNTRSYFFGPPANASPECFLPEHQEGECSLHGSIADLDFSDHASNNDEKHSAEVFPQASVSDGKIFWWWKK